MEVTPGVLSVFDKMDEIVENEDGSVSHKIYKAKDGSARSFKCMKTFNDWKASHATRLKRNLRTRLSPHQFYITQGKGTERAFTGEYVWTNDLGTYCCVTCTQRVFLSEHKYQNKSGYPTFWNTIRDTI
jgi:hypothetical protein